MALYIGVGLVLLFAISMAVLGACMVCGKLDDLDEERHGVRRS